MTMMMKTKMTKKTTMTTIDKRRKCGQTRLLGIPRLGADN